MRGKKKGYLYCPKCKTEPRKIIEKYLEPIEESRKWDGFCYELEFTNLDSVEFEQLCSVCRTRLKKGGV